VLARELERPREKEPARRPAPVVATSTVQDLLGWPALTLREWAAPSSRGAAGGSQQMVTPQPAKGRADTFDYANSTTLSSLASRPADRTRAGRLKLNRRCTHKVMIVAD